MPESWCNALMKYKYEVNLANYPNAQKFPIYFNQHISGDRDSTINFEYYFRKKCSIEIEPWFEVVFWKMYSQGKFIRDSQTNTIIQHITQTQTGLNTGEVEHRDIQNLILVLKLTQSGR